jgi:hypothetical protein
MPTNPQGHAGGENVHVWHCGICGYEVESIYKMIVNVWSRAHWSSHSVWQRLRFKLLAR